MRQLSKHSFAYYFFVTLAVAILALTAILRPTASAAESKPAASAEAAEDTVEDTAETDTDEASGEAAPVEEKQPPEGALSATDILSGNRLIAHGMGAVDGFTILNCLEGFQAQYAAGVRVFEADLRLTRDCQVVLRHDWWNTAVQEGISWVSIPTREKFVSEPINGKYTPLSFRDLLLLMEQYPDICIITDTKFTESDVFTIQFDAMLRDARELGLSYLFDRIVVQVYSTNMITALNNIYPFPHYIYTFYQDGFNGTEEALRERLAICVQRHVEGVTMAQSIWKKEYAAIAGEYGVRMYVHTVNDPDAARKLLNSGVDGIYSDSLTPAALTSPAL